MNKIIYGFYFYRILRYSYFHVAIGLIYFQSVGLSLSEALSLESIYYITKSIFDVPGAYFSDSIGRKISLIISGILCSLAYFLIGTNETYLIFSLAEIILGIAMSISISSDSALIFDELKEINQLNIYKKVESRGWALRNLGFGIASMLGGWIVSISSLSVPFLISSFVILISTIIAIFYIKEPSFNKKDNNRILWFHSVKEVIKEPIFMPIVFIFSLLFIIVRVGFWSFQPILMDLDINIEYFGVLFGLTLFVSTISTLYIDKIKGAINSIFSLMIYVISSSLFLISFGLTLENTYISLLIITIGFMLHAIIQGVYDPIMRTEINNISKKNVRATIISIAIMLGNIGFAVLAPLYGYLVDNYGQDKTLMIFGLCTIFVGNILLSYHKRKLINIMDYK